MKTNFDYIHQEACVELSDLALCTTLRYSGFKFIGINRDPKNFPKVNMIFEKTDELMNAIQEYWNGTLRVEPKAFWNIGREIKSQIKETQFTINN